MTSIVPLKSGQEITLSGVEKYVESDAFGDVVCPDIVIWDKLSSARKPIAVAKHGEKAILVDMKRTSRHVLHYKVKVDTDGGDVTGWVMFPFVDESVKESYGSEDIG